VSSLDGLALARATVDRSAHRRNQEGLVEELLADPRSAVVLLAGDRLLVEDGADPVRVALLPPAEVPATARAAALYLGEDGTGRSYLAVALPADGSASDAPAGTRWAGLRDVGALLDDAGAGLFTAALGLGNWHAVHSRCARCGSPTDVVQAGWARRCPECGAEHYPRTDPAVIMAVVDADDRLLLGHAAHWAAGRWSTLAGFVEAGESMENAVRREVLEEAGIVVGAVDYRGSQPWPFPASLMLGFLARAVTTDIVVDGAELADARWFSRDELAVAVAHEQVVPPGRASIARALVEEWFGGPL
jgi:NAD+ diphosphatase